MKGRDDEGGDALGLGVLGGDGDGVERASEGRGGRLQGGGGDDGVQPDVGVGRRQTVLDQVLAVVQRGEEVEQTVAQHLAAHHVGLLQVVLQNVQVPVCAPHTSAW